MIILGIDPGIGRTGWGIIQYHMSNITCQMFGCFETSPKDDVPTRLLQIHKKISTIIQEYTPDFIAIEELFFNTNAKTAMVVGQARGVAMLTAAEHNIPVSVYTPLQVKIAITGYGRAEKSQIGHMVKTLLKLKEIPKPDDTADALAIALTHGFSNVKR